MCRKTIYHKLFLMMQIYKNCRFCANIKATKCKPPGRTLSSVSRAPVGFPPHPPSLSLVFQFSHSSAYARVFLSLFSLIGVILFCSFFFLNRSYYCILFIFLLIGVIILKSLLIRWLESNPVWEFFEKRVFFMKTFL